MWDIAIILRLNPKYYKDANHVGRVEQNTVRYRAEYDLENRVRPIFLAEANLQAQPFFNPQVRRSYSSREELKTLLRNKCPAGCENYMILDTYALSDKKSEFIVNMKSNRVK